MVVAGTIPSTAREYLCFQMIHLFLFYVHWCFIGMYVHVRVLDPLELELQTTVNCHVGAGN